MNIFYLDKKPELAAQYHCDKHAVKMILESCQLLSTAHRVLDGKQSIILTEKNRKKKIWTHPEKYLDDVLYTATHVNHPSAVWVRESRLHYIWLWMLTVYLNEEFVSRYDKEQDHLAIRKLGSILCDPPKALLKIKNPTFTPPPMCMPHECMIGTDVVASYRNYYNMKKTEFAAWRNGKIPDWYIQK